MCVCEDTAAVLFSCQFMFKLISLRILTERASSGSARLDVCSPGTDKGANSGGGTWRAARLRARVGVRLNGRTVCAAAESVRERGRPDRAFHTRLGDSFTHHCSEHTYMR